MEKILFENNIIVLGYGSIAKAVLPLIHNHFDIEKSQIHIIAEGITPSSLTVGMRTTEIQLTKENFTSILDRATQAGDLVVNLTAGVNSIDLMDYCSKNEVMYLDTCIEMWPEEVTPDSTTYDDREMLLKLKKTLKKNKTTILSSMGANPGIVSLLTKRVILKMCDQLFPEIKKPITQQDWAQLANMLTVRVIHINERDTQYTNEPMGPTDFASTWSVEAMIIESIEPAEMSIGTHEQQLPDGAQYSGDKNKRDIHFNKSGKDVQITTWLPLTGEQKGMILNHNEPFSIAELYATEDGGERYSPTVCFVYHPSDQTMESLKNLNEKNYLDFNPRLLLHDIEDGYDELGVFVMTEKYGSFWLGSRLDIHTARSINPESSATSLQVAGGVLAGMCWVITHPNQGILEPEDIHEHDYVLDIAEPYWGTYFFEQTDWMPNTDTSDLQFLDFYASHNQQHHKK